MGETTVTSTGARWISETSTVFQNKTLKVDGTWKLRLATHLFSDDVPTNFVEMIGSFAQNDQVI